MQSCPNCGTQMKLVPAGTSKKTGKKYSAFFSCENCKTTMNQSNGSSRPNVVPPQEKGSGPVSANSVLANKEQQRAWGKSKNMQIALQGLIQSLIVAGADVSTPEKIDAVVRNAEIIRFRIQEFADTKTGFDRAVDQVSSGTISDEELTVEDIPF